MGSCTDESDVQRSGLQIKKKFEDVSIWREEKSEMHLADTRSIRKVQQKQEQKICQECWILGWTQLNSLEDLLHDVLISTNTQTQSSKLFSDLFLSLYNTCGPWLRTMDFC